MGFDHSHYVPILKGSRVTKRASEHRPEAVNESYSAVEIPPIPPAWPEGENQKPVPGKDDR